ncbi:hypothetical protein QBC39DRAFT_125654 [Podospora conica]|nr:hypothetical protein QBC39DRAFT_125654 [Schizothecium conicum]
MSGHAMEARPGKTLPSRFPHGSKVGGPNLDREARLMKWMDGDRRGRVGLGTFFLARSSPLFPPKVCVISVHRGASSSTFRVVFNTFSFPLQSTLQSTHVRSLNPFSLLSAFGKKESHVFSRFIHWSRQPTPSSSSSISDNYLVPHRLSATVTAHYNTGRRTHWSCLPVPSRVICRFYIHSIPHTLGLGEFKVPVVYKSPLLSPSPTFTTCYRHFPSDFDLDEFTNSSLPTRHWISHLHPGPRHRTGRPDSSLVWRCIAA